MEKIITLIINRRWLIATVFGIVSIFGFYAWRQLPIDAYPDIADVTVQVVTQVPGTGSRRDRATNQHTLGARAQRNTCPSDYAEYQYLRIVGHRDGV